jgi:hypothetical protein
MSPRRNQNKKMKVKNTYSAPTDKQLAYAAALGAKKVYRHIGQAYKACFGKSKVGGFNRAETSELIDWLSK